LSDEKNGRKAKADMSIKRILGNRLWACCLAFVIVAVAVVTGTVAWYSAAREGKAVNMNGEAVNLPFELAVKANDNNLGTKSVKQTGTGDGASYSTGKLLHDITGGEQVGDGKSDIYTTNSGYTGTFYTTNANEAEENDDFKSIKWRLSTAELTKGIGPDSSGEFTFYVVPKQNGNINIHVKLWLEGYTADVKQNENETFEVSNLNRITSTSSEYGANTYLNGHILFFRDRTGSGTYYYRDLIRNGEFELELSNCEANELVPVTVYWIWPNTFAQLTCIAENGNIANAATGASEQDVFTVTELRNYVVEERDKILMADSDLLSKMTIESGEGEDVVHSFDKATALDNLKDLSMGYNNADQEIGTKIQYFLLTLTAE
jgi:hypothetical protein